MANTQYFSCLPGQGVFATAEHITIIDTNREPTPPPPCKNDIERFLEKNVSSIFKEPEREEIVTKYGEYPSKKKTNTTTTYLRNSLSLQDMLDVQALEANPNNDFDQNSVIQSDRTYMLNEEYKKPKKQEVDLVDIIGGWPPASEKVKETSYASLKKNLDKNENVREDKLKVRSSPSLNNKKSKFYLNENPPVIVKEKNHISRKMESHKSECCRLGLLFG